MANKRKYIYTYSNNTDEEEFKARQEFAEMIFKNVLKKGITIKEVAYIITALSINFVLYFKSIISTTTALTIAIIIVIISIFLFLNHKNKSGKN